MEKILQLFVYGTLKRGSSNHDQFCRDAVRVEEATVCGNLYSLPFGFPGLIVPDESICAVGTTDYEFDAVEQHRLGAAGQHRFPKSPLMHGEIFTFDDPEVRLPELDCLEGFDPSGKSFYRRVLVPAATDRGVTLVWAYTIERPAGEHLPAGSWPS